MLRTLLVAVCTATLALSVPARTADEVALLDVAANLDLYRGKKAATGAKLQSKLPAPVRRTLNSWAPVAERLDLGVAVAEEAEFVVLGRAERDTLVQATRWADDTWELFDALRPAEVDAERSAFVAVLFDGEGLRSPAWKGLLDELVERKLVTRRAAADLESGRRSLTVRQAGLFLQPTIDLVGDKSAGDDEFRLGNEIAHKLAQLLVERRFGRQPDMLRWGVGYVAEQRQFGKIYQFNATGFVSADDHVRWPDKTRDTLDRQGRDFSLARMVLHNEGAGRATPPQRCAWSVLDYQLAKAPDDLATLLGRLGSLHAEGDASGRSLDYEGDLDQATVACSDAWDDIKTSTLQKHLKRLK